jgi:hypothetical protein
LPLFAAGIGQVREMVEDRDRFVGLRFPNNRCIVGLP